MPEPLRGSRAPHTHPSGYGNRGLEMRVRGLEADHRHRLGCSWEPGIKSGHRGSAERHEGRSQDGGAGDQCGHPATSTRAFINVPAQPRVHFSNDGQAHMA